MTKAERIGIAIGLGGVLIGILAWQFPVSEDSDSTQIEITGGDFRIVDEFPPRYEQTQQKAETSEAHYIESPNPA